MLMIVSARLAQNKFEALSTSKRSYIEGSIERGLLSGEVRDLHDLFDAQYVENFGQNGLRGLAYYASDLYRW